MIRSWIVILLILCPTAGAFQTYQGDGPNLGRIVVYSHSLSNSTTGDWPRVVVAAGIRIGLAAAGGANMDDCAACTGTDIIQQAVNGATTGGVCDQQLDLFSEGAADTCIADREWHGNDSIVIFGDTNDVSAGSASTWDSIEGPAYSTALDAILVDAAATPAKCFVVNAVPRNDNIEKDALIPTVVRDRIVASIAANHPQCSLVDAWQGFHDYGEEFGSSALSGLYSDDVHATTTPNERGDNGVDMLGTLILNAIVSAHSTHSCGNRSRTYGC